MSDATGEQIAAAGGFLTVRCCGAVVGYTNPRPFTLEAAARFEEIRQRHVTPDDPYGNGWTVDPEANALIADPATKGPPPDGERLPFACQRCGASFVWAGGAPRRVPKETT